MSSTVPRTLCRISPKPSKILRVREPHNPLPLWLGSEARAGYLSGRLWPWPILTYS